ncbi:arginase [Gemmobacter caeni]|jgi:arginase|uniref:Arginase n=2 Tax=Gemmobacter TaxID=204456 RepID=A0A2T6AXL7_9RHOB|nr:MULTISPECIES: arginase [Gemmobacter]PTX48563.1 arginase [Gemmobacter caeni]TWI99636.1 arginase [Gemmobacter caeni]GHC08888.1 arginase [Gemmobacter nanjingensis]
MTRTILIGAPVDSGQRRPGCLMGPAAYRVAGIAGAIRDLGHGVEDWGDVALPDLQEAVCANPAVDQLPETLGWTEVLADRVDDALSEGAMPVILGGDHSLALGSVSGAAAHARRAGRPLFLLWLDAHSDFHTPMTTTSGNLHGTPVAYIAGRDGFDAFPPFPAPIPADRICLYGIRSVDPAEHAALLEHDIAINDMRVLDEHGIVAPLRSFLTKVREAGGMLHVSLDVDFLDPSIAPAVGTTVPGGTTFREAHLVMELLHESGLVTSLDLVELNPFLDDRGRTAKLMVDLVGSLMGRKVFDRPTRSFT